MNWNNQDPPVSDVAIGAAGYCLRASSVGTGVFDMPGKSFYGLFKDVKWAQTPNGAGLFLNGQLLGYPGRTVEPTPLDIVRQDYYRCVWPGCKCETCRVRETEHARGVPIMFYVFCPECGVHGPERWERSEAVSAWKVGLLGYGRAKLRVNSDLGGGE